MKTSELQDEAKNLTSYIGKADVKLIKSRHWEAEK